MLITLWNMAIEISGGIVDSDRWHGTLEGVVASPVGYPSVILGRVMAVSFLGLFGVAETGIVARVGFGASVPVHHPDVLVGGLVVTALAMTGTATLLAAVFVLTRTALTFQNTMNYPFYLLGGVLVPLSFLPVWVRPAGRVVFLSWSADLLRDFPVVGARRGPLHAVRHRARPRPRRLGCRKSCPRRRARPGPLPANPGARMTRVRQWWRVLSYSAVNGFLGFAAIYTFRSWTFGLLGRMITQVAFFASIGRLLGSTEQVKYLLVGNAVMVAANGALTVVQTTSRERNPARSSCWWRRRRARSWS